MNTTLLFVEIFIAGIQGLSWLCLLLLSIFGYSWMENIKLDGIKDWTFLISALLIAFSYSLGIVVDRSADFLFSFWDKRIKKKRFGRQVKSVLADRFQLENEFLNKQIEYIRSRMRIARSSSLNFLLITLFTITFIPKLNFLTVRQVTQVQLIAFGVGAFVVILFILSWYSLINTHYSLLSAVLLKQDGKSKKEDSKNKKES